MSEIRVKSTGTIKLFESDNTSHVTIASPASLSANRTITIPDADVTLGAGTTINNNADNRVITGSGTANTLEGEANLTYNGTIFGVGASADLGSGIHVKASDTSASVLNSGEQLVLERNSDCGMSILSATNGSGNIYFGDSGDNDIGKIQYSHDSNLMYFTTNASEAMRIHSNQVIASTAGIALGVGNANTASNVLNDYEEGSWVPNWASQGGSVTGSSGVTGTYIKIGKQVTLNATGILTTNSASTNYKFSNAPFQANGNFTGIGHEYGQTGTAQIVWIDNDSSQVNLKGYAGAMIQNPYLRLTITYFTD